MSLGILPQIITTVATVGPTVYGLVDAYQQRQRENARAMAQAAAEHGAPMAVQVNPSQKEWVVPVTAAVAVSGVAVLGLWWWSKKNKKGKKSRRSSDDE